MVNGKPLDFEQLDDLDEDTGLGVGAVEQFTWKGLRDFSTCTECGRCQSQCPAWHTEKPLSPKLLITALRDHAHGKHPGCRPARTSAGLPAAARAQASGRGATVSAAEPSGVEAAAARQDDVLGRPGRGVSTPERLWSWDLRRVRGAVPGRHRTRRPHRGHAPLTSYDRGRVPVRVGGLFGTWSGPRTRGGCRAAAAGLGEGLPFAVPLVGPDLHDLTRSTTVLGRLRGRVRRRQKRTTAAVAELLHHRGVSFAVLGDGESCTGDPARRAGNEFLFQQLAMQNVEGWPRRSDRDRGQLRALLQHADERGMPQLGGTTGGAPLPAAERLVREGRLTPVAPPDGVPEGSSPNRTGTVKLPRPVLHRPPQWHLCAAAGADRRGAGRHAGRDAAQLRALVLRRRRWRADVDGGESRHPDQHDQDCRGGRSTGAGQIVVGCPFLPGDALRRAGHRAGRGPRRRRRRGLDSRSCCWPPSAAGAPQTDARASCELMDWPSCT